MYLFIALFVTVIALAVVAIAAREVFRNWEQFNWDNGSWVRPTILSPEEHAYRVLQWGIPGAFMYGLLWIVTVPLTVIAAIAYGVWVLMYRWAVK